MGANKSPVIVYEDNHVLVVDKPVLLATMGTAAGERSLARELQAELKRKYQKPGNVYLGIVSRLDTVTSGLIVFAKTSKAAGRLTTQFQQRQVDKWYLAAIPSVPSRWTNSPAHLSMPAAAAPASGMPVGPDAGGMQGEGRVDSLWWQVSQRLDGRWLDRLWKDDQAHRMRCEVGAAESDRSLAGGEGPGEVGPAGRVAAGLDWRFLGRGPDYDLVAVRLLTGRKHQIRVQFAARGLPILGDRKYGSPAPFPAGIALHSWRLAFTHPVTQQPLSFVQSPPPTWRSLPECQPVADLLAGLNLAGLDGRFGSKGGVNRVRSRGRVAGVDSVPAADGSSAGLALASNPAELVRWLMEADSGAEE